MSNCVPILNTRRHQGPERRYAFHCFWFWAGLAGSLQKKLASYASAMVLDWTVSWEARCWTPARLTNDCRRSVGRREFVSRQSPGCTLTGPPAHRTLTSIVLQLLCCPTRNRWSSECDTTCIFVSDAISGCRWHRDSRRFTAQQYVLCNPLNGSKR